MKKEFFITTLFFWSFFGFSQNTNKSGEQFPVFPSCNILQSKELENCFYTQVQDFVYNNFKIPQNLQQNNYNGTVIVLFEVDNKGKFNVIYVDANEKTLVEESKNVFGKMPKITPPTYNGVPTYSKYTIKIAIPLKSSSQIATEIEAQNVANAKIPSKNKDKELTEFDNIKYNKFANPKFESHLNIPFSHSFYAQFDDKMNQVGSNNHTGSKPYSYEEVSRYYDLKSETQKLNKKATSWGARKLWNENTVEIQGNDYWFTFNPILDLQVGKSASNVKSVSTFVNTRGIQFQGGLGKQLNFSTTIFESQGKFADYYNNYANSIKSDGGNPAIIPGIGIAKEFKNNGYDFPSAEANISYTPSKFMNLQLGYGRNFIGDGYRSLLESDGASPYPYFKLNTTFWKIKYTNTYLFLKDVRPDATFDKTFATKYMANHYLSWNVSKRMNIGLFESVIWGNGNQRGFDVNFLNPIIFYRTVEFSSSSRSGNALLGLTGKYKYNNQINLYGQFLLDEFSLNEVKAGNSSWKNKYGYQLGAKYYNAFDINGLLLQVEYNHVRPYVYSHLDPLTNYGHNNQNIGHQWGGNFEELIGIAHYHKGRYFADAKLTYGKRGLDFDTATDAYNYGSNIYLGYNDNRPFDTGVKIGQGNKTTIMIADLQAGYLVNPSTNLKFFGSLIYRNFNPTAETLTTFKEKTTWFSVGLRADVFNWYYDY